MSRVWSTVIEKNTVVKAALDGLNHERLEEGAVLINKEFIRRIFDPKPSAFIDKIQKISEDILEEEDGNNAVRTLILRQITPN